MPGETQDMKKYQSILDASAKMKGWVYVRTIGGGTYGTVIEVQQRRGTEHCALKCIPIPLNDKEFLEAEQDCSGDPELMRRDFQSQIKKVLEKEIAVLELCKGQKNVVQMQDYDIVSDPENPVRYYILICMELLIGLRDYLQGKTQWDVLKMFRDIAQGLEFLERRRVLHRDIKRENIMVDRTGAYKLTDFGEARDILTKNAASTKAGTPYFMAPEVFNQRKYDSRADIYSLAMTVYHCLFQFRYPFQQPDSASSITAHEAFSRRMSGAPIPPIPDVDKQFNAILLKCLEYDPRNRYPTAQALLADINRLMQSQTFVNHKLKIPTKHGADSKSGTGGSVSSISRRGNTRTLRLVALAAVAACLVGVAAWAFSRPHEETVTDTQDNTEVSVTEVPPYEPARVSDVDDVSRFNGTWQVKYISSSRTEGAVVSLSDADTDTLGLDTLTLEIRDGFVRMSDNGNIESFDFSDSRLSIGGDSSRALALLEDGMLTCAFSDGTVFYERVSADSTLPTPSPVPVMEAPTATPAPAIAHIGSPNVTVNGSGYVEGGLLYVTGDTVVASWSAEGDVQGYSVYVENESGQQQSLDVAIETDTTLPVSDLQPGIYTLNVGAIPENGGMDDALWGSARFAIPESAPPSEEEIAQYVGSWYLTRAVSDDESYSLSLVLNPDGTSATDQMGSTNSGTWHIVDDGIEISMYNSENLALRLEDDQLVTRDDAEPRVFSREPPSTPEPTATPIPTPTATPVVTPTSTPTQSPTPAPLQFANSRVEEAAQASLEKTGPLYASDLKDVTTLDLGDAGLTDDSNLSDLAQMPNLRWLYLHKNSLTDLSCVSGLTQLEGLELSGNAISDLSPLAGLTQLRTLSLTYNRVSDLTPLSGLTQLKQLYLMGNDLSDISPLAALENLQELDLRGIPDIADLTPLMSLDRLEKYQGPEWPWPQDDDAVVLGVFPEDADESVLQAFRDAMEGRVSTFGVVQLTLAQSQQVWKYFMDSDTQQFRANAIFMLPCADGDYTEAMAKAVQQGCALHMLSEDDPQAVIDEVNGLYQP